MWRCKKDTNKDFFVCGRQPGRNLRDNLALQEGSKQREGEGEDVRQTAIEEKDVAKKETEETTRGRGRGRQKENVKRWIKHRQRKNEEKKGKEQTRRGGRRGRDLTEREKKR